MEGERSDSVTVDSGTPQGSAISPSLFLFYINTLPENLTSKIRLFADDTIVYLTITCTADAETLQRDLNLLADWEKSWKMVFHPDKCNVISITRKHHHIKYNYTLHGHTVVY